MAAPFFAPAGGGPSVKMHRKGWEILTPCSRLRRQLTLACCGKNRYNYTTVNRCGGALRRRIGKEVMNEKKPGGTGGPACRTSPATAFPQAMDAEAAKSKLRKPLLQRLKE